MLALSNAAVQELLGDKLARLRTWTIRLFINDAHPSATSVTADFIEPNFHGYAPQLLDSWGAVFLAATGIAETDGDLLVFAPTDSAISQTIHGWFATDAAGNYRMGDRYTDDAGVTLADPSHAFVVRPMFREQAIT